MNAKRNAIRRTLAVAGVVIITLSGAMNAAASTPTSSADGGQGSAATHGAPPGGGIHVMCLACVE